MPDTTLQIWPTADGTRFRCTCPWKHDVPFILRDLDPDVVGGAMAAHVQVDHGWQVVGVQVLTDSVAPSQER